MSERYKDMVKVPKEPAAKMLSNSNVLLKTPLESPASASPEQVLLELEQKEAWQDILTLMSVLLPARERVWWACLAARDYIGPKTPKDPPPLAAAEKWVFEPNDENREAARQSLDNAYVDDDTTHCANAVIFFDGRLGSGDLAEHAAPAGVAEMSALGMNVVALGKLSDKFETHIQLLIDRAVDIARGGSGRIEAKETEKETS